MKQVILISIGLFIGTLAWTQPAVPEVDWNFFSTGNGKIEAPNGSNEQTSSAVFDIDKDGVKDFIITERRQSPSVVWYKKNGSRWDLYVIDDEPLRIEAGSAFYDIDDDGDLDPVFAGDSESNQIWWWENPYPEYAPQIPWKRHIIKDGGANKHHDQIFGDFDGDGLGELVFWNQNQQTLFLADIPENPRKASEWEYKAVYSYSNDSEMEAPGEMAGWRGVNEHEGLAMADIDMDGVLDIVGAGWWFKHIGKHKFVANVIDASYGFSRCAAGQIIEGGRPEVVLVVGDGLAPLFLYEWQDGTWVRNKLIDEVDNGHSIDVVDFNGDGHLDIFNAEMRFDATNNPDAKLRILLGDGQGNFTDYIINEGYSHHEARIADLDADGDYDIMSKPYAYRAPGIDIWLQNGTNKPIATVDNVKFNQKVGLQLYSLRHEFQKGVPAAVEKISKMGFKQVETSGYFGYEPDEFKKLLDKYSLSVPSMIFGWEQFEQNIETVIREAKLFGAEYIGVGWLPHDFGDFTLEDARKSCELMNQFAATCKEEGLTFFYHLHGYEFGYSDGQWLFSYIMENTTSDVVFELDTMWALYAGYAPEKLLEKYGERFKLIHLKDLRWGSGPVHTGGAPDATSVALGNGQVNFAKVLQLAREKKIDLFFIEDEAKQALNQIPKSLKYLKRF